MSEYYTEYKWRNGIPYGIAKLATPTGICYKLPMDPYRKRIAIERYQDEHFQHIIYDSALLDFRHLRPPADQTAWQKSLLTSTSHKTVSHIRNQDDRLLYVETCVFEGSYCTECHISSPHGFLLSTHRMFYQALHAPFDGVILYDANSHPVMCKKYKIDPHTHEFSELITESWEVEGKDEKPLITTRVG